MNLNIKNLYNFSKNNKNFKSNFYFDKFHPDGEEYKYKIYLNSEEITKNLITWYKIESNHFHLGYIGFKENFQHKGILKNYIHPHCIDFMKKQNIEIITLKPLVNAFVVWVLLGFEPMRETEEREMKSLIKEFLLENDIISKEDFDKMQLKEIVEKYKEVLKSNNFPPKLEKMYYTNFRKVIK
jgi:hypothetical protein